MALIQKRADSGEARLLAPLQVIGRAPSCRLRDLDGHVSGLHAEIRWDGARWLVEDLGSRNGTWVNGRRLRSRDPVELKDGAAIAVGRPDNVWTVLTCAPPVAMAESSSGQVVCAFGGALGLPETDEPAAVVYKSHEGAWVMDSDQGTQPVESSSVVTVADTAWTLHLPEVVVRTITRAESTPTPRTVQLEIHVDTTSDWIEASVMLGNSLVQVGPRSSHSLLLLLAEARQQDSREGLHEVDQGWMHQADVTDALDITGNALYVAIHRLRRQFAAVGVEDFSGVVERRAGQGELRLGMPNFVIRRT